MVANNVTLLAIVGPTASGKTGLAIEIAKRCNGEIIAADSRTVYKGLDIGTAKPTVDEKQGIPHFGLDLVSPGQSFTVGDFKTYADAKIREIKQRNNIPILVGGTGLYIDSVLYDFSLAPPNEVLRESLQRLGIIELQKKIQAAGLVMPENKENKRHLIRTLERGDTIPHKKSLPAGSVVIGINPQREILRNRIEQRAKAMLAAGVLTEVEWGLAQYGLDSEAMTGGIYRIFRDVVWGKLTEQQAIDLFVTSDMQLAKRQITWFKRNSDIKWFETADAALDWFQSSFMGTLK